MSIVIDTLQLVDNATQVYVTDKVGNFATMMASTFGLMLTLYIMLWGIMMWRGAIDETWRNGIERVVKIGLIYGLVFGSTLYSSVFVDVLTNGPARMAAIISDSSYLSVYTAFEMEFIKGIDKISQVAGSSAYGTGWFVTLVFGFMLALVFAYATFLIVLAKIAIAVLVALGPLFILALMFDTTKRMFESWLQQCINYFLIIVLTVAVMGFLTTMFKSLYANIPAEQASLSFGTFGSLFFVFIIAFLVLSQVMSIASGLAGGMQLSTLGVANRLSQKLTPRMPKFNKGDGSSRSFFRRSNKVKK